MSSLELHAESKVNIQGWVGYACEAIESPYGKYFEVRGAVCPLYTEGKNKGKPNYQKADKSTEQTVSFTPQQHDDFVATWEAKNNLCMMCHGKGEIIKSFGAIDGLKYRQCDRCHGSGKPPTPPESENERSHKALAVIEIIDKLNCSQKDFEDLTGYLAARCGIKLAQWLNPVDFSDLVEQNPAIAQILNPESQVPSKKPCPHCGGHSYGFYQSCEHPDQPESEIIYSDEKSTITIADCYPCPISGKPCPTNGEMGTISHYYYPGDCPNFKACEDTATQTNPCPCGDTYANNCNGSCPSLNYDIY